MKYGRHYNDEDIDMYYRMQLNIDEFEHISGSEYIHAKIKDYDTPPGIYELTDLNTIFPKDLEVKADENFMKTTLTAK